MKGRFILFLIVYQENEEPNRMDDVKDPLQTVEVQTFLDILTYQRCLDTV